MDINEDLKKMIELERIEIGEAIKRLITEAGDDIEIAINDLLNYSDILTGIKKY